MSLSSASLNRGTDQFADVFLPVVEWLFDENSDFVADLERKLAQARMEETVELYVSRALGFGAIGGFLLWFLGLFLGWILFGTGLISTENLIGLPISNPEVYAFIQSIKIPALVILTGIFFGAFGFISGFGTLVAIPYSRASYRKRQINMLLPDAVSFMYALSVGGLNQLEILEAMARADDVYGEVAREFRIIVQETEYFDIDYRTAIRTRSLETPSEELSQFFTDMLSIINSGGDMTGFLEDKKDKHMRTAKQQQQLTLETLELFGEMYMTLSLFPLLLIIVLVIMSMLGQSQELLLYATVYLLLPLLGVAFLVLVSTVKQDDPGDGYLQLEEGKDPKQEEPGLLNLGIIEDFVGSAAVFDRIRSQEGTYTLTQLLKNPHHFFRDNPLFTLALSVPAALVLVGNAVLGGAAPVTLGAFMENPIGSTFIYIYLPLYVVGFPLAFFYEWNNISRHRVTGKLSENLRKLSSANDTGLTLLESIKTVAETSPGRLGEEFAEVHAKVNYGMSLKRALTEFNNKYHIPRLARTVNLIAKAQEVSSQITAVLTTAAQASENQDDINRERKSRSRMQVVIIVMTYLTLLAVMVILQVRFLDVMAGLTDQAQGTGDVAGGGMSFGAALDLQVLEMLFFHAVTIQGILAGFISGYIREAKLLSGVKFAVVLPTIALGVWAFI